MSLRIIGGVFGGRVLRVVRGLGTRPLLGQVREAIFNILADRIEGAIVWDLFAGSGASGIEALSRGANTAVFCEKNGRAVDVLRGNLQMLGPDAVERSIVLRTDAWDPPVLSRAALMRSGGGRDDGDGDDTNDVEVAPDLVFLDPPYSMVAEDPVKSLARARRLLDRTAAGGVVVFHCEAGVLDEDDFDGDVDVDLREWGNTAIAMMWRRGQAPERVHRRRAKERRHAEGSAPDADTDGY